MTARLQRLHAGLDPVADAHQLNRVARLQGLITWNVKTRYHERLTQFYEHLEDAQQAIDSLTAQYQAYIRVRQAATHSYEGYEVTIKRQRRRVQDAIAQVDLLMSRQGRLLEQVAIRELENRARRLDGYQVSARYALADSYDRATQAQSRLREGEQ